MAPQANGTRGRALLVEQDDLLRWSIQQHLAPRGFALDHARDGSAALASLSSARYDVVVTDLAPGGCEGLAVAAEARRLHAETQVVILSRQASKQAVLRALRLGVADFLEMPIDLERLRLAMERALEMTLIQRELVRLAQTDGLTGLFNQRHFYAVLEKEIGRARRQGHPLSVLLLDVDDFKLYNDRFGHLAGDVALARLASCLRQACRRDTDGAFRYGGDEFVLVLPEADPATAAGVAERVRSLLREEGLALTVSVGAAALREGQDLRALIREADQAMYRDKGGAAPARLHHAS